MKKLIYKYRHAAALLYFPFYIAWFFLLANREEVVWHYIESPLDAYIPFLEVFSIPYYLWFAFVPGIMIYFFFRSKEAFCRSAVMLFSGMTLSLIAFTVYPTAINFRPELTLLGRNNFCMRLVEFMYETDPGTNVFPSIHCFNSLALMISVREEQCSKNIAWLRIGSTVLTVLICLSTVLIKQHSVIDVAGAVVMTSVLYAVIYLPVRIRNRRSCPQNVMYRTKLQESEAHRTAA